MKLAFITLTNNGYKEMTKNCLISLKKIGINYLKVFCIDQESYDYLSPNFNFIYLLDIDKEEVESELINYRVGNWSKVVYKKFDIIHKELQNNDYVLFTDGDIVYKKPGFIEYCLKNIGNNDILIQDDKLTDSKIFKKEIIDVNELCTGFMLIKKNKKMEEIFDPKNIPDLKVECDQYYINSVRDKFLYKKLPMNLFPNGSYFRLEKPVDNYMIHFNFIIGSRKKEKMIKYGYWYL